MSGRADFMGTPFLRMIVSMHAMETAEIGGPRYIEKPQPSPGPGEVLIKAEAIGVNYIDTYFRSGHYQRPLPFGAGHGSGRRVGDGVTTLAVGDRVVTAAGVRLPMPNSLPRGRDSSRACSRKSAWMWPLRRC